MDIQDLNKLKWTDAGFASLTKSAVDFFTGTMLVVILLGLFFFVIVLLRELAWLLRGIEVVTLSPAGKFHPTWE